MKDTNNNKNKNKNKETFSNMDNKNDIKIKECQVPTRDNPFMNVLPTDNRKRNPACKSYNNKKIKKEIEKQFSVGLYKDVNSVYDNVNSQRMFFTNPNTTIPNDQESFAKWCYEVPKTCKEGNGNQCVANNIEKLNGESYQFH